MNESRTAGWVVFIAAMGMMAGLMAEDIRQLEEWSSIFKPSFLASILTHFAAVVTAFIGGRVIPSKRNGAFYRTRWDDDRIGQ